MNDFYRMVVMLLEGFTLIVGLASLMFMLVAVVCAAWDSFVEMGRSGRAHMKQAPTAHSHAAPEALASLDYSFHRGASSPSLDRFTKRKAGSQPVTDAWNSQARTARWMPRRLP